MKLAVTRDACPICGEDEDLELDIYLGHTCYCRACRTTWNYESGEIWGYTSKGKKTDKQTVIDNRRGARQKLREL